MSGPAPTPLASPVVTSAAAELSAHRVRWAGLHAYAASVMGSAHGRRGGLREDAYAIAPTTGAAGGEADGEAGAPCGLAVAVADGLGSTRDAHAAALLAVEAAVTCGRQSPERPWADVAAEVARAVDAALGTREAAVHARALGTRASADSAGAKHRSPASTLAVAVVATDGERHGVWWLAVGDTAVLVFRWAERAWEWLSTSPDEQFDSGATAALPGLGEAPLRQGGAALAAEDVVVLASDGVWPAVAQLPEEFARGAAEIWAQPISAAKFATVLDFDVAGLADDRTLVMVRATGPAGGGPGDQPVSTW